MGKRKNNGSKKRKYKSPREERSPVRAKKYLGQHFLKDEDIARQIANTLTLNDYENVLEIGPGTGVLTKYLLNRDLKLVAMDLDAESIVYLNHSFLLEHPEIALKNRHFTVLEADFLKYDIASLFQGQPFAITGNFPYNISTQIVFKLLEMKHLVPEFSGMFQKEVARRICAIEGNKTYGILSVLVQAFYEAEYLFTVAPGVFEPPPKVESGVLLLRRKENYV
ncbi:MAG: 16S rRNA (adenine(1518)-N(6)/adenine(1519)-N(6))-dimethyltransferase RsmA, partial [Flavobacteriaceae bacterium]